MSNAWNRLLKLAREEVAATIRDLPPELRAHAETLPVSYEPAPSREFVDDGLDADLLGLFVGDGIDVLESERSPLPRQIFLFLENLWDFAEEDEEIFREEVHITFIHEFGHYLGLDEDELEERGLL
jgi:predicted Zn-dependent protease with MMP-like domain